MSKKVRKVMWIQIDFKQVIAFTSFKTGLWLFFWNRSSRETFWTTGIVLSNSPISLTSISVSRKFMLLLEHVISNSMFWSITLMDL